MTGRDFQIDPEFAPLLRSLGLDSFEKISTHPSQAVMRSVPGRATVRLQIGPHIAYLKRYEPEYYSLHQRVLRALRIARDEARHEWNMIGTLQQHGFKTATRIAYGRQGNHSFVMTQEIAGGVPADEFLRTLSPRRRREFAIRLAELTRQFHGGGFIYKDYYLSHIFVANGELHFIDLQRVKGPQRFHPRWLVKDLGTLAYSAQRAGATRTDLMKFYKVCFQKTKLNAADKRLIGRILQRTARLHARPPKYDVIWDANSL